jgi:hypothetical protein
MVVALLLHYNIQETSVSSFYVIGRQNLYEEVTMRS